MGCCPYQDWDYHEISREEMTNKFNSTTLGHAEQRLGECLCDIYIMAPSDYVSGVCYDAVVDHEEKHCEEGSFHGSDPWYIEECHRGETSE